MLSIKIKLIELPQSDTQLLLHLLLLPQKKMTLPRRAPCSSEQTRAFVTQEIDYFKQELERQANLSAKGDDGRKKRKTPLKLSGGVSGGKRLNHHASSVLFGWLEEHMENP